MNGVSYRAYRNLCIYIAGLQLLRACLPLPPDVDPRVRFILVIGCGVWLGYALIEHDRMNRQRRDLGLD